MNVNILINGNCELVVSPETSYIDDELQLIIDPCNKGWEETYVEFLVGHNINSKDTLKINPIRGYYTYALPDDGLYVYYCIKTMNESEIPEEFKGLYYDRKNKQLIFQNTAITDFRELATLLQSLGEADGVKDYIEKCIFSICNLKKCITKLQKQAVTNCKKGLCQKADQFNQMRDFLFVSIYVLETLICQERYMEALDMLKSLRTCTSICKTNDKKGCGCNG